MKDISYLDSDKLKSATSEERKLLIEIIHQELHPIMNKIHGLEHSERFWKLVLKEYVGSVISKKEFFERQVLNTEADLFPMNSFKMTTKKDKIKQLLINTIKFLRYFKNKRDIEQKLEQESEFFFSFPIDVSQIGKRGVQVKEFYPLFLNKRDNFKRKRANAIAMKLDNIYLKNIVSQLPKIYVEYFTKIYRGIKVLNPNEKTFHVHNLQTLYSKILIGKYLDEKAKLILYQHGGFYGEYKHHNAHAFESSIADEFRTWGWKIKENDIPWKAYRCEKFLFDYQSFYTGIEFDAVIISYGNRLYIKDTVLYLLDNLKKEKYSKILCRPRPFNKISSHKNQFDYVKSNDVKIGTGKNPIAEDVAKSKIVIQTKVPSTNFLECMYVDHPTVGLLVNADPAEVILPYYNFFLEVGVLHNDYQSLTNHLNSINIEEWWMKVKSHKMYVKFKNTFARDINEKS